jgi:hypothetical protein
MSVGENYMGVFGLQDIFTCNYLTGNTEASRFKRLPNSQNKNIFEKLVVIYLAKKFFAFDETGICFVAYFTTVIIQTIQRRLVG